MRTDGHTDKDDLPLMRSYYACRANSALYPYTQTECYLQAKEFK